MVFNNVGENGTTVSFTDTPTSVEAGSSASFEFTVEVGNASTSEDLDVEVKAFLYVSGENDVSIVSSTSATGTENDIISGDLSHVFEPNAEFNENVEQANRLAEAGVEDETRSGRDTVSEYPRIESPIWVKVEVDYFGAPGYTRGTFTETASTSSIEISVTAKVDEPLFREFGQAGARDEAAKLSDTFKNRTPFSIQAIEFENDATYVSSVFREDERGDTGYQIRFDYPNPTVSIDTAGRFAKHEIIGGSTVRQKIGEDPINVSVNGVCKRRTANQIDSLRDAKSGQIFSDRLPGSNDSLRVQFGSTSTEPMTDGGSADITDGRYLYSFQINVIEVIR